ncbi:MAG: LLM class flavin-dependent oxidoreductase [Actinomycetota bacterium]
MRHAVFVAPFGPLADPHRLIDLAVAVEASGWDALFLWDHVLRRDPAVDVADPWVLMGAVAAATDRIRIGPMVTPIVRRRLVKLAREALTVDALSRGRLTLGLGLGVDTSGELSKLGDPVDPVERGRMLDEGVPVLPALLAGEHVEHRGSHYTVDDVRVGPPSPQGRPPLWFAARADARRPVRRAAAYDGVFPIEMDAQRYDTLVETIVSTRGDLAGFDIAVRVDPGESPPAYTDGTATWAVHAWPEIVDPDVLDAVVAAGPPT